MSRRLSFVFAAVLTLALGACTNPTAPDATVPAPTSTVVTPPPPPPTVVQGSGT